MVTWGRRLGWFEGLAKVLRKKTLTFFCGRYATTTFWDVLGIVYLVANQHPIPRLPVNHPRGIGSCLDMDLTRGHTVHCKTPMACTSATSNSFRDSFAQAFVKGQGCLEAGGPRKP